MIETKKSYVVEFSEEQATELYHLLLDTKDIGELHINGRFSELRPLFNELKELFDN